MTSARRLANHRSLVVSVVAGIAVLALAGCGSTDQAAPEFPDAELAALDGTVVDAESLIGEPMVVNFWFSTCVPCATELVEFAAVHEEVGDEVRFVGVNPLDDAERMKSFASKRGVDYELYADPAAELQSRLGITSFPATAFVDADGTVVDLVGVLDADGLRSEIDELLAGDSDLESIGRDVIDDGSWNGIVRRPAPVLDDIALPSASEPDDPVSLHPAEGRVSVVYFGFTSCPDVCPTTMADLSVALNVLGDRADLVDVVMISVDPERDQDRLTDYVTAFVPTGVAVLTNDDDLLRDVAEPFGASWDVRTVDDGAIEVDHTAFLYAVDDDGRLAVSWPFGTSAQHMADDLDRLLDAQGSPR